MWDITNCIGAFKFLWPCPLDSPVYELLITPGCKPVLLQDCSHSYFFLPTSAISVYKTNRICFFLPWLIRANRCQCSLNNRRLWCCSGLCPCRNIPGGSFSIRRLQHAWDRGRTAPRTVSVCYGRLEKLSQLKIPAQVFLKTHLRVLINTQTSVDRTRLLICAVYYPWNPALFVQVVPWQPRLAKGATMISTTNMSLYLLERDRGEAGSICRLEEKQLRNGNKLLYQNIALLFFASKIPVAFQPNLGHLLHSRLMLSKISGTG